jgi:hypothetical protein
MRIAAIGVSNEIGNSSVDRQSYVAFVIAVVATLGLSIGPNLTWNEITLESNDEPITTGIVRKLPSRAMPKITPANFSPELIATMKSALDTAVRVASPLVTAPLGGAPSVPQVSARGHAGWTVWIAVVRMRKI